MSQQYDNTSQSLERNTYNEKELSQQNSKLSLNDTFQQIFNDREYNLLQSIQDKYKKQKKTPSSRESQISRSLQASRNSLYQNQHERLYHESTTRREKENIIQNLNLKQINEEANQSKLTESTYKVLINKLEQSIMDAFQQVLDEDQKQLSFQELGRILYLLDVFQYLKYDEDSQFVNQEIQESDSRQEEIRRYQEMLLHEKLWNILTDNNENYVQKELLYCILRILLDPARINQQQKLNVIQEYLNQFQKSEYKQGDEIQQFFDIWDEVIGDYLFYKNIRYLKPYKFQEFVIENQQKLTFNPKINPLSYQYEQQNTEKFLSQYPIEKSNQDQQNQYYNQLNRQNKSFEDFSKSLFSQKNQSRSQQAYVSQRTLDRINLLYKRQEVANNRIREEQNLKQQEEQEQCTFKPNLDLTKSINSVESRLRIDGQKPVHSRLYNIDQLEEKYQYFSSQKQQEEEQEMEGCTFKPQILKSTSTFDKTPSEMIVKGFKNYRDQQLCAKMKAEQQKLQLEHIPIGENYERNVNQQFNPPSQLYRPKKPKKQPFKMVDIKISSKRQIRVPLYEGDSPERITQSFAKIYSIDEDLQKTLYQALLQQFQIYQEKKLNKQHKLEQKKLKKQAKKQELQQQEEDEAYGGREGQGEQEEEGDAVSEEINLEQEEQDQVNI